MRNPFRVLGEFARQQLEVDDARDPARWLRRLFLLGPRQARPLPGPLEPWFQRGRLEAARRIGVSEPDRVFEWLLHLLFHIAPATRGDRRGSRAIHAIANAVHVLMTPVRLVEARLARTDLSGLERAIARGNRGLQALPAPARGAALLLAALAFWIAATTPLNWNEQLILFLVLWTLALTVRRMPGNVPTLILIGLSLAASGRYIWWRYTQTLVFDSPLEHFFGYGLVAAESYTWLIMLLGYVQNAFPLGRAPLPLPEDRTRWPTVDVYIPTYNEPLAIVKPSVYAALGMDWPRGKLKVWLLDDGRRPEFRAFAAQAGCEYLIRPDNFHAKAGNLNHALKITPGEFIAIFDCDHVPVRSFLTTTMGWLVRDARCAMVQTPHHFFSPDPFERNLGTFGRVPNEGTLFYGLVQDGNDLWNAGFFCGSCAVLRRTALEQVGGIAVDTVTEDAHTALRLHRRGWSTAYIGQAQAAGLSTESLAGHVGQRIRWARGMAQIFRIDNPLLGRGLSLFQRLCYSNAMLHFFNGLPRLVFLTSPLAYLYLQLHVINAAAPLIAVYALPHLVLSGLTNSRMQGRFRHSFWAEVYEAVLAWYIALPTTLAVINPRLGKFNVTAKGGLQERTHLDFNIARPYLALMFLNAGGVALGLWRLAFNGGAETGTLIINLAWALYNLAMLGTAVGVATESRQIRRAPRVPLRIPAQVLLPDGRVLEGMTSDYSSAGLGVVLAQRATVERHEEVRLRLADETGRTHVLPLKVALWQPPRLGLRFDHLSVEQEKHLIQCTFGRSDAWHHWDDRGSVDRPLSSLGEILRFGLFGYRALGGEIGNLLLGRRRPGLHKSGAAAAPQETG